MPFLSYIFVDTSISLVTRSLGEGRFFRMKNQKENVVKQIAKNKTIYFFLIWGIDILGVLILEILGRLKTGITGETETFLACEKINEKIKKNLVNNLKNVFMTSVVSSPTDETKRSREIIK